jgi:MFS transporter, OFA family, oxalate/formate antiporter
VNKKRGIIAVIAGVFILMCLGIAYSWGVFLVPIEQDMGWDRTTISFAVSILLLVFSFFMSIGGMLEKKIGPNNTASIGAIFVGLGWIMASFANSPFSLYLFYGGVTGIGTGLSYMPSISTGIKWFPQKKAMVTGIIIFGFGFGSAFIAPIKTSIIPIIGWRNTMLISGIIFGIIILIASRFLSVPSAKKDKNISASDDDENNKNEVTPKKMLRKTNFKILFITYFLSMIPSMMVVGHIIAFLTDKSFSPLESSIALVILSICNGLGRVIFGIISDLIGSKKTLLFLFSTIGLSSLILYYPQQLFFYYFICIIIGLCFGGFLSVYPSLTADLFGKNNFSVNYGIIFIGYGIGCFSGPILAGLIYDIYGTYLYAFTLGGTLALLGGLMILKVRTDKALTIS